MQKIHHSITIRAPREKVWHTMLDDATYRIWTEVFAKGSHYVGDWSEGSKILFLAPGNNAEMGMVSRIAENRPYEFLSIEHLGVIENGVEDTTSEAARKWAPAYENYTFTDTANGTEVVVDMDIEEEHRAMFEKLWPAALEKLKELTEQSVAPSS